jgi:hypothetical protein
MTMLLLMFSGKGERAPGPQTVNLKICLFPDELRAHVELAFPR